MSISSLPDDARPPISAIRNELLRDVIQSTGQVRLRVSGTSMVPTIWPGDELVIERISGEIAVGDIIAFTHENRLFVHRVIAADALAITTQGDCLATPDPPVRSEQLIGAVARVLHGGKPRMLARRRSFGARLLRWASRFSDKPVVALLRCRTTAKHP